MGMGKPSLAKTRGIIPRDKCTLTNNALQTEAFIIKSRLKRHMDSVDITNITEFALQFPEIRQSQLDIRNYIVEFALGLNF